MSLGGLTVCVTYLWVGVDSAWEQEKLEGRKLLKTQQNPRRPLHALLGRLLMLEHYKIR